MSPSYRAWRTALVFAGPPAILVGLVLGLAVWWLAGLVAVVVIGGALLAWAWRAGEKRVVRALGPGVRPADPVDDARLANLVEGLCVSAGVSEPRLLVVDSPALNAATFGYRPSAAVVVVTSGLLAEARRIELEGVLAACLWSIRHSEVVPATVLAATGGALRALALSPDMDSRVDIGAVSLTRYPPALAAAYEKMAAKGASVGGVPPWAAHLWLVDPRPDGAARSRIPLAERAESLREL
jgi:hypothetical protein